MKFATRYLLPVEILVGVALFSWGCSGGFGGGTLWATLKALHMNETWGFWLCSIGAGQVLISGTEFALGKRWNNTALLVSISGRMAFLFLGTVVWFYICYMALLISGDGFVVPLLVQSPACLLFSAWAYAGNLKIRCVLDPDIPTDELEKTIIRERREIVRGANR